jgi:hypothetical protein
VTVEHERMCARGSGTVGAGYCRSR